MPKIDRSAFLYMDPVGSNASEFGQCGSCRFGVEGRCVLLGHDVDKGDSCGLYVHATEEDSPAVPEEREYVSDRDAGYVRREVRCENCKFFDPDEGDCELFEMLNNLRPETFDLDEKVEARGCCNAQTPIGSSGRVGETFERV